MPRRPILVLLAFGALLAPMLHAQTPRGPEIAVNQRHRDNQWLPRIAAAPNGDFVVVWGSDPEPTTFDESSQAWYRLFGANGAAKTAERRVSNRKGEKEGFPAVAMGPDGGFIVVWHSGGERDTTVYGRRFNAAGQPPRSEVRVAPAEAGAKAVEPRVGMDGSGGFVVSWLDSDAGFPERRLLARRFAAGAAPLGPALQVNTGGPIATISPLYDMDVAAGGEAVFVWTAFGVDVIDVGILGRLFAADGTPGDTFEVQAFDVHTQERPAVTFGRNGGFLAAWRSSGTERPQSGNALYVRRFNADGTPRGGKIEIDHSRQFSLDYPAVALNGAGRGVIAWTRFQFDAEILARRLVQAAP